MNISSLLIGAQRMRIGMTLDIWSYESTKALSFVLPQESYAAECVEIMAGFFSIFSLRVPYDSKDIFCALGSVSG